MEFNIEEHRKIIHQHFSYTSARPYSLRECFVCPLTRKIYFNPVIAEDGFMYEEDAIKKWLDDHDTSPITNETISSKLIYAHQIKYSLHFFIKENPYEIVNVYKPSN